ncbi:MAG TPA: tripartite tricarboxylate transporter substrate binding protein [Burkholderiales bacterium]|nr:tripartite tricarboxylate transporter substrate binding protein [Burkholderiales bacterium]
MKKWLAALATFALLAGNALAQTYPAKPVKLIVPFPPGGNTDIVGRLIAEKLSASLGEQVYVDNRGGAGGTIGAEAAAKSPNDGYTLFFSTTGTLASAPSMRTDLRYDPVRDFAPIATLANAPVVVIVRDDLPVKTLSDLISLAKAKPGTLKFGSAGTGHFVHIAGEMFKTAAGVDMLHVPYKGVAQALVDLLGGRIDVMFDAPAQYEPHFKSGKVRALAVAAPRRLARLPDVPTTAEAGLPGYVLASWFGLAAPAGTPAQIVALLNAHVQKALAAPDVVQTMAKLGLEPGGGSAEQYAAMIVEDLAQWRAAVKRAGIKIE